jgi:hypothetical protein
VKTRLLIGMAVVLLMVCPAFGGPVTDLSAMFGLFNTGVGAYTGVVGPTATPFTPVVTATATSAGWMANTATSSWIGPVAVAIDTPSNSVDIAYAYSFNFNLAGYIPATFHLDYDVTADDAVAVFLNGTNVAGTWRPAVTAMTSLNLTGAGSGMNTMTFIVTNVRAAVGSSGGNPTGLNVRFTGASAEAVDAAIPEPATLGLIGGGLLALGLFRKRR